MKRRAVLGAVVASVALAGCSDDSPDDEDDTPSNYSRYVDCEAGVVIYEQNSGEGGFEVVPIEDTDLEYSEVCDDG